MGLLELCEELFGTVDLYQVLGVRREASDSEVRRGYHKMSLQVHPDRVGEGDKEDATRRFQVRSLDSIHRPPGLSRGGVSRTRPGVFFYFSRRGFSERRRGDFSVLFPADPWEGLLRSE